MSDAEMEMEMEREENDEQEMEPQLGPAPLPPVVQHAARPPAVKETYEDTRRVIRDLITGLTPRAQSDLGFIEKTAAMMHRMDMNRSAELNKLTDEQNQLNNQLKRVQQEHTHQSTRLRSIQFQQKTTELQKESVELAKELSELETNHNWASGELSKLKGELAALEARSIPREMTVTEDVIRLQLIKQTGVQRLANGSFLIHSDTDVNILPPLDAQADERTEFQRTNDIWNLITPPVNEDDG